MSFSSMSLSKRAPLGLLRLCGACAISARTVLCESRSVTRARSPWEPSEAEARARPGREQLVSRGPRSGSRGAAPPHFRPESSARPLRATEISFVEQHKVSERRPCHPNLLT